MHVTAICHPNVVGTVVLRCNVKHVDAEVLGAAGECQPRFTKRYLLYGRHLRLDKKPPSRCQMPRSVSETGDLGLLCRQIVDGVENKKDEREVSGYARRRHVAYRDLQGTQGFLFPQLSNHGVRKLDTFHKRASLGKWYGYPPRSDGEFKDFSAAGQVDETIDGLADQVRVIATVILIVRFRNLVVEISIAAHEIDLLNAGRTSFEVQDSHMMG